jgi:hypothetical protein
MCLMVNFVESLCVKVLRRLGILLRLPMREPKVLRGQSFQMLTSRFEEIKMKEYQTFVEFYAQLQLRSLSRKEDF